MISGLGTDIIEVSRIREQILKQPGLKEDLFTAAEIEYCENKSDKAQHYAARFAAKEALLKAMGTGLINGMKFREIEIKKDDLEKPFIVLLGKTLEVFNTFNYKSIHVSMSHLKDVANAIVIIEK